MIDVYELADWILVAVGELGGTARRADVLHVVERLLGSRLANDDIALRPGNGELVWKNNASFARKQMVDCGMLHPTELSGRGIWALTLEGTRRSDLLRSRTIPPLCPTFRAIATDVVWRIGKGRPIGLVPVETTFTDNALLHLAISHPAHVSIQRFGSQREAVTGADWEWWIRDPNGYVGFRVQAKRASPRTGHIALDQRAAPSVSSGHQIEVFVDRCRADGIAGLYCVYSDRQPTWRQGVAAAGPCPHGPTDLAQWGCTVVLADTAHRLAREGRVDAQTHLAAGLPWYHLVCHHAVTGLTSGVRHVFENLQTAETSARNENDAQDRPPPLATEPPRQVEQYFLGDRRDLEPRTGLAGIVLIDAGSPERLLQSLR